MLCDAFIMKVWDSICCGHDEKSYLVHVYSNYIIYNYLNEGKVFNNKRKEDLWKRLHLILI